MTIEERHDCELCYVRVRLCRMGREKAQQRGTVAVLGRGEREREVAVPFRVHIVILAPDAQQSK